MNGLAGVIDAISQQAPALAVIVGALAAVALIAIAFRLGSFQQAATQEMAQLSDEIVGLRATLDHRANLDQRLPLRFALAALIAKHKDEPLKPEHLEEELEKLMADWESLDYAVDDLLRKVERAQQNEDREEERGLVAGR